MSLTTISSLESGEENFSCTLRTPYPESRNQTFLGSGGRKESNSQMFARIGEKKIFHQLDVHHVKKVRINVFGLRRPK